MQKTINKLLNVTKFDPVIIVQSYYPDNVLTFNSYSSMEWVIL